MPKIQNPEAMLHIDSESIRWALQRYYKSMGIREKASIDYTRTVEVTEKKTGVDLTHAYIYFKARDPQALQRGTMFYSALAHGGLELVALAPNSDYNNEMKDLMASLPRRDANRKPLTHRLEIGNSATQAIHRHILEDLEGDYHRLLMGDDYQLLGTLRKITENHKHARLVFIESQLPFSFIDLADEIRYFFKIIDLDDVLTSIIHGDVPQHLYEARARKKE